MFKSRSHFSEFYSNETINGRLTDEVNCWCGSMVNPSIESCMQCNRCLVWQHLICSNDSGEGKNAYICIKCLPKKVK